MSDTFKKIVKQDSVKQLSATPLNPISQGQMWLCPCNDTGYVKKVWILEPLNSSVACVDRNIKAYMLGSVQFNVYRNIKVRMLVSVHFSLHQGLYEVDPWI